ncbi:DNA replication complex GINS protein Sld5 isoform X1 [Tachypleus tridentatus]|uniref:DNA replication complex GINS protein Sld5 isoform X1 n=1 Tax=Tachypleus tridentatus TaxID=6853 RepID=UPI003FD3DCFF
MAGDCETHAQEDILPSDEDETELTTPIEVLQKLEEAWLNEKFAPELLPYKGELVDCMLDQLQHMDQNLHHVKPGDFRIIIHKMELDRIRFVLNSYLRIRLEKIERFGAYFLSLESQEEAENIELMSPEEKLFAQQYVGNIEGYLHDTILQHMPPNMEHFQLATVGSKPNLDSYVFFKVLKDTPNLVVEEGASETRESDIIDLEAGSQHIIRYRPIYRLLQNGTIKLI